MVGICQKEVDVREFAQEELEFLLQVEEGAWQRVWKNRVLLYWTENTSDPRR